MRNQIIKFWTLANSGKSAALDVNTKTGEMAVLYTKSINGAEGNGAIPECYSSDWIRVVASDKGVVHGPITHNRYSDAIKN